MSEKEFDALMAVDSKLALQDVDAQREYINGFDRHPADFDAELNLLENRLKRVK